MKAINYVQNAHLIIILKDKKAFIPLSLSINMIFDKFIGKKCIDNNLDKEFEDIKFLRSKIANLEKSIEKGYFSLKKDLEIKAYNHLPILRKRKIIPSYKRKDQEIIYEEQITGFRLTNEMMYDLDSFFIDIKRCIEFIFRLIAKYHNLSIDFKLENLLEQISPDCNINRSKLAELIINDEKSYLSYLLSEIKWLKTLNYNRTQTIHYEVFNLIEPKKVIYVWKERKLITNYPDVILPEITVLNKDLLVLVRQNIEKLDLFIEKSFNILSDAFIDEKQEKLDL